MILDACIGTWAFLFIERLKRKKKLKLAREKMGTAKDKQVFQFYNWHFRSAPFGFNCHRRSQINDRKHSTRKKWQITSSDMQIESMVQLKVVRNN